MPGLNRVILCGSIGRYGVEMRYSTNGTACASFMLVIAEEGQDGNGHSRRD